MIKQKLYELYDIISDSSRLKLIIFAILFGLYIIFVFPLILHQLKIFIRARKDYRLARGTQHLKQIRNALKILNKKFKNLKKEKHKLENSIQKLGQERDNKLLHALSCFIVETRLTEVEGIGSILQSRIISQCFDGTLQSLRKAYNVYGVGEEKWKAILDWVNELERDIPRLLKGDFPNKKIINEEYDQKEFQLNKRLNKIEKKMVAMNEIMERASTEVNRLRKVRVSHFMKAYRDNGETSEIVNRYLLGIFPEWSSMPDWFRILISQYGD